MRRVAQGFIETTHLFKRRPDVVVPLLQKFLGFNDAKATEELYRFYQPLFVTVPRPLFPEMEELRKAFVEKYPAAKSLNVADIADPSIIEEIERSGFIERLQTN